MSGSRTSSRPYVVLMTLLTVLLVVAFAMPASASGQHPGRGGKASLVANAFGPNVDPRPSPPPRHITCRWVDDVPQHGYVHTYVCTGGGGYRQPLSTPAFDDNQDYLDRGGNPPEYDVANPDRFTCDRRAGAGPEILPSDYTCTYRHRHDGNRHTHTFRMDEMVTMADPFDSPQLEYVWPPHK